MGSVHQICLRWNNHLSNFPKVFEELRKSKDLVDVTLCCEGRKIKAHKLVLSACSQYFQGLFSEIPCKHPVIFFRDVTFPELESVVNYMYKGEVSVPRDNLDTFLKTAESLQVKGLVMEQGGDDNVPAIKETVPVSTKPQSRPAVSVTEQPLSKSSSASAIHIPKESSWSQSFMQQNKSSTPSHKEPISSSQTTFTPTSIHQPHTPLSQTTFSPASLHQPPTPQSLGAGSSLQSQPEDDDDDVIIEPEIKFEAMDQSVNDNASASMTDNACAKSGSQGDMDENMYITGDDPSDSFSHGDRLSDEIDSIMSNIGSQGGGGMEMGMGPSTSSDGQGEDGIRRNLMMYGTPSPVRPAPYKRTLSLAERIEVIRAVDSNKSMRTVAREYGINAATVCRMYKNKHELLKKMEHWSVIQTGCGNQDDNKTE